MYAFKKETLKVIHVRLTLSYNSNIAGDVVDMSLTLSVHVGRCCTPLWEILDPPLTLTSFHKLKLTKLPSIHCFNCRKIFLRAFYLPPTKLREGNVLTSMCHSVHRGSGSIGGGGDLCS